MSLLQESARHNPGISAYDVLSANSDGCDVRKPLSYYRQKEVRFWAKDTRALRVVGLLWPKEMFVATLGEHVHDPYRHAMRYFGLLAPRSKRRMLPVLFALLKQEKRSRPARLSWADLRERDFGVNPLVDRSGKLMRWTGRLSPVPGRAQCRFPQPFPLTYTCVSGDFPAQ